MKKNQLFMIAAGLLVLVSLLGGYFLLQKKDTSIEKSLSEIQTISSTAEQETQKQEIALSVEKQKQLNQISELSSLAEQEYHNILRTTLQKYQADITPDQETAFFTLVGKHSVIEELKMEAKQTLGISFLPSDLRNMLGAQENYKEEQLLELARLEDFKQENSSDIASQTRSLMELTLHDSLVANSALAIEDIVKIVEQSSRECFESKNILDTSLYSSKEKQLELLGQALRTALEQYSPLTETENTALEDLLLQDIKELDIFLHSETSPSADLSYSPVLNILHTWENFYNTVFPELYAAATSPAPAMTAQERQRLLLKTQIQIDLLIQKSIETEIQYNQGALNLGQYNTQLNEILEDLEERVIFQKSLQNDASVLSLEDIERFDLGGYVDDSSEIQTLTALAYIQKKSGHIIVYNLHGKARLADENTLIYPGYGVETLGNSTASLVFSDESVLRLEALSRVNIQAGDAQNIQLELAQGNIWTRVLKPLLSGDVFTIDAGDVSLGVRGTSLALSKTAAKTDIHIVDSYMPDGSESVTLTETDATQSTPISKGKKITIDSNGTAITPETKSSLLTSNPNIGRYIGEDLSYLSLLLDDRNRGFYNTPLSEKNDSDNFLKKVEGELQDTLPNSIERNAIIKNPELAGQVSSSGSIYGLLKKDQLISAIKANPLGNTTAKIAAITALNMEDLETTLRNKRAIERRFDYNITQQIVTTNSFTVTQLKDMFVSFPIESSQNIAKDLAQAKQKLQVNSGSSIVTGNISPLPTVSGINITWKSSDTSVISDSGIVRLPAQHTDVIFTATLSKQNLSVTKDFYLSVQKPNLTQSEKLEQASGVLREHLESISPFSNNISIAQSIWQEMLSITGSGLVLTWKIDKVVSSTKGALKQNNFPQGDIPNHSATGTLSLPGASYARSYTLQKIRPNRETVDEKLTRLAGTFWGDFKPTGISETQITGTSISLPSIYNKTLGDLLELTSQATISYIKTGSGKLSGTNLSVTPGTTTQTVTLTPKLTIGTNTKTLTEKQFIVPVSQAVLAKASIDKAKADFIRFFPSNPKKEINTPNMPQPPVDSGVKIKWQNGGSSVSEIGNVILPGPNDTDKSLTLSVILSHPNTTYTQTVSNLQVILKKLPCDPPNIKIPNTDAGVCYGLVASAEYETNLNLQKVGGGSIAPSTNLPLIPAIGGQPAGGGVTVSGAGKYLKYTNLFTTLGISNTDDWVIEMNVRESDLSRSFIPGSSFTLFGFLLSGDSNGFRCSITQNNYTCVDNTNNISNAGNIVNLLGLNTNSILISKNLYGSMVNNFYVGSNNISSNQWGGKINFIRIYKKN